MSDDAERAREKFEQRLANHKTKAVNPERGIMIALYAWVELTEITCFASRDALRQAVEAEVARVAAQQGIDATGLQTPNINALIEDVFNERTPMPALFCTSSSMAELNVLNGQLKTSHDLLQRTRALGSAISSPQWGNSSRENVHSMLLGPSGSGKTTAMAFELAERLARKTTPKRAPVVTILTTLDDALSMTAPTGTLWWAGHDADRLKHARSLLPRAVVAVVNGALEKHVFQPNTHLVVAIDEIGILPGIMSKAEMWSGIAKAVRKFEGAHNVSAVHVAAGGTGGEPRDMVLSSNQTIVQKIRMPQWSPATLKQTVRPTDPNKHKWDAVLDLLTGEPHGVASALTNARMAVVVLMAMFDETWFLSRAWDAARNKVNAAFLRNRRTGLLDHAVSSYAEKNGLSRFAGAIKECPKHAAVLQQVLRGVGLGALRVAMNQRTFDVQSQGGARPPADTLDDVCARAAERFGLLASNFKSDGVVANGRLAYEMHAGTVLVALHLVGLDVTELPPEWQALEELTMLAAAVTAASDYSLVAITATSGALRQFGLATLPSLSADVPRGYRWDHQNCGRFDPETRRWTFPLPECPIPFAAEDKAQLFDVAAVRGLFQCMPTLAGTKKAEPVDIEGELVKSGLLRCDPRAETSNSAAPSPPRDPSPAASTTAQKTATTKQTANKPAPKNPPTLPRGVCLLNLLLSEWAKYEEADASRQGGRRAEDFATGTSTLGRRHMYPLCLLLQTGAAASPPPFKVTEFVVEENGGRLDGGEEQTAAAIAHSDQLEARLKPRLTTKPSESPGPQSPPHAKWCEFRFVVSDLHTVGAIGGADEFNHALAVFSRPSTDSAAAWTRVACSAAPNSALDTKLANVAQRLRRDMDLTLVAITVTHVCDPSGPASARVAAAPDPQGPQDAEPERASKKHRAEFGWSPDAAEEREDESVGEAQSTDEIDSDV